MNYLKPLLLSTVLIGTAYANTNDFLNDAARLGKAQQSLISPEALMHMKQQSNQAMNLYQQEIHTLLNQSKSALPKAQKGQYIDGALLFVSFSMPEALLFSLAEEAAHYQIPVVINGLVDKDFRKTLSVFSNLQAKAKKEHHDFNGVSIDPLWFEQFHINAVPALVVSKRPSSCGQQWLCQEQTYDVVYGNASVTNSLHLIAQKGEAAPMLAQQILEKGHV